MVLSIFDVMKIDNVDTQEQILGSIQKDNFKMEGLEI